MQDLKKIESTVLLTMIAAHSSYYGRALSAGESKDCKTTISQLQAELKLRKEAKRLPFLTIPAGDKNQTGIVFPLLSC